MRHHAFFAGVPALILKWDHVKVKTYRRRLPGRLAPTHETDKILLFFCLHLFKHEHRYQTMTGTECIYDSTESAFYSFIYMYLYIFTYFLVVQVPVCRRCPASLDPVWGWVKVAFHGFWCCTLDNTCLFGGTSRYNFYRLQMGGKKKKRVKHEPIFVFYTSKTWEQIVVSASETHRCANTL